MPRPNPAREAEDEVNLAKRIAYERERAGMTYDGLAKRMTDLGCPIHGSAIYKIEKATPRRRVTVNEFKAFATVFAVPMAEMLVPEEIFRSELLNALWAKLELAVADVQRATQVQVGVEDEIGDAIVRLPELEADVVERLGRAIPAAFAYTKGTEFDPSRMAVNTITKRAKERHGQPGKKA